MDVKSSENETRMFRMSGCVW